MITEADYNLIATSLTIPIATAKTVASVESGGITHWPDGKVPILFEALYFHNLTHGVYDQSHPNISSSFWNQALYEYGDAEYARLEEAEKLNSSAALQSASWGAFQVMGANWQSLGYASVEEFVESVQTDEGQMESFIRYIQHNKLENALRRFPDMQAIHEFTGAYNGEANVQIYSAKILAAYHRFESGLLQQGDQGEDVLELQDALHKAGFLIGAVDGDFGPATRAAVMVFQHAKGLGVDGVAGPATRAALKL